MNRKYTTINQVLIKISMSICFIVVIIITCNKADTYSTEDNAWIYFVLGCLIVVVFHALWAIVVEISNNIINIGDKIETIVSNTKKNFPNMEKAETDNKEKANPDVAASKTSEALKQIWNSNK